MADNPVEQIQNILGTNQALAATLQTAADAAAAQTVQIQAYQAMHYEARLAYARLHNSRIFQWNRAEAPPPLMPLPLPDGQNLPKDIVFPGTRKEIYGLNYLSVRGLLEAYNQPNDGDVDDLKTRFDFFISVVDQ